MNEKKSVTTKIIIDLRRYFIAPLLLAISLGLLIGGIKWIAFVLLALSIPLLLQRHLLFDSESFYLDGKRFNFEDVESFRVFGLNESDYCILKVKNLNTRYFLLTFSSMSLVAVLLSLIGTNQKLENFKLFVKTLNTKNPRVFKR
jgi:hypothetical protein